MILNESAITEFGIDNVKLTEAFGFGMPLSEAMAKLYEGSVNIKGEDQAALIKDSKAYVARTEKMIGRILDNPEQAMNSQEFIDLIQRADIANEKINDQRKKLLKMTDQELQMTDTRIINRILKGDSFINTVQQEYSKTFNRMGNDFDKFPEGWFILFLVGAINSIFFAVFAAMCGPAVGMAIAATFVAPITEEIGRYIGGGKYGRSFTYAINTMETISYVSSSMSAGLAKGLFVFVYRMLFSANLHEMAETKIQSAKLRAIVDREVKKADTGVFSFVALAKNITNHGIFNGAAMGELFAKGLSSVCFIIHPLMLLWEFMVGRFRNEDLYESTEIDHNKSLFAMGLTENIIVENIAPVAAAPTNGGTIDYVKLSGGDDSLQESFAELFKLA